MRTSLRCSCQLEQIEEEIAGLNLRDHANRRIVNPARPTDVEPVEISTDARIDTIPDEDDKDKTLMAQEIYEELVQEEVLPICEIIEEEQQMLHPTPLQMTPDDTMNFAAVDHAEADES